MKSPSACIKLLTKYLLPGSNALSDHQLRKALCGVFVVAAETPEQQTAAELLVEMHAFSLEKVYENNDFDLRLSAFARLRNSNFAELSMDKIGHLVISSHCVFVRSIYT